MCCQCSLPNIISARVQTFAAQTFLQVNVLPVWVSLYVWLTPQKQNSVKITSAKGELITIWCKVVQGNEIFFSDTNHFCLISSYICILGWAFTEFHSHSTFYGYVLSIWYLLLARNSCVNVVSHKLSLKLLQNSTKIQM